MFDLGDYKTEIILDSSKFVTGMNNAEKRIESFQDRTHSFSNTVSKVATTTLLGLSTALVGAGFAGVKANADLEQYRNTLNTVMGDVKKAGDTLNWVKEYAAKTPFEVPGLVDATVKLSAMGLEAQKFLPIAGDMAAVFKSSGKTVSDAAEAINDAMMGEFERLKEFGIKLQQTDFKEGGKYAGKTYAEALEIEFKKHNYAGAAEALSSTFLGRLSTLKDTVGEFLRDITGSLFTTLSEKMGNLMQRIDELKANGTLQNWADQARQAFETAFSVIEKVGGFLISIAQGIYENWNILSPILAGILGGFMAFQAVTGIINAISTAQAVLNAVMAANPIGIVVVAIAGLVSALTVAYYKIDWFREFCNTAFSSVSQYISVFVEMGKQLFSEFTSFVQNIWQKYGDNLLEFAHTTFENIKQVIQGALDIIKGIIQTVTSIIKGDWQGAWDGIKKIVSGVWEAIKGIVKLALDTIIGIIKGVGKILYDVGSAVFTMLWDAIKWVWNNVTAWIGEAWDGLVNFITGFGTKFYEIGKGIFNYLWDGIKNIWNSIKNWIADKVNWLVDKITFWDNNKEKVQDDYEEINSKSTKVINKVPSYDVGTPYVPRTGLALIHEGEAIIPKQYNPFSQKGNFKNGAIGQSLSNTYNITFSPIIQVKEMMDLTSVSKQREIARAFSEGIGREMKIQGMPI